MMNPTSESQCILQRRVSLCASVLFLPVVLVPSVSPCGLLALILDISFIDTKFVLSANLFKYDFLSAFGFRFTKSSHTSYVL